MASSEHQTSSKDILYRRYSEYLREVDVSAIVAYLVKQGILTEKEGILTHPDQLNRRRQLCRTLTTKGSSHYLKTSQAIKIFKQGAMESHTETGNPIETRKGATTSPSFTIPNREGKEREGKEKHLAEAAERKHAFEVSSHTYRLSEAPVSTHLAVSNHSLVRDVPDPPINGVRGAEEKHVYQQMEAFVVLFYTLILQQIQSNRHSAARCFPWLKVDVDCSEKIKEYFPRHAIQGVCPTPENPVTLQISMLLNAFQQFYQKFRDVIQENTYLSGQAKLVQEVMQRNLQLEDQVKECQRMERDTRAEEEYQIQIEQHRRNEGKLQARAAELQRKYDSLKKAFAKSEERNKQLVAVTQQWAIECQQKEGLVAVLEAQVKEHTGEIERLKRRLVTVEGKHQEALRRKEQLKKELRQLGAEHVTDSRFEELRTELADRRELHDRVMQERDEALDRIKLLEEKNGLLKQEIEEYKDQITEMGDRMGNFKFQAQVKEPSVREMSKLLQEKRELEEERDRLQKQLQETQDELLAHKTMAKDLAQVGHERPRGQHHPRRQEQPRSPTSKPTQTPKHPAPTQAMITGHTTAPTHQQGSRVSRSNDELDHTAQYTEGAANATTQPSLSRPRSAPNHPQLPNPQQRPLSPLQYHQTVSATTRGTQQAIPNSVAAPPTKHEAGSSSSPRSPSSPIHKDPSSPTALTNGHSGDYTQRIRYPNNSGILVRPLENEDLFFLEQEGLADTTPKFFDHTPLMPAQMSPPTSANGAAKGFAFDFTANERKCPVCQKVFLTLGEREFQSHVAGCFT